MTMDDLAAHSSSLVEPISSSPLRVFFGKMWWKMVGAICQRKHAAAQMCHDSWWWDMSWYMFAKPQKQTPWEKELPTKGNYPMWCPRQGSVKTSSWSFSLEVLTLKGPSELSVCLNWWFASVAVLVVRASMFRMPWMTCLSICTKRQIKRGTAFVRISTRKASNTTNGSRIPNRYMFPWQVPALRMPTAHTRSHSTLTLSGIGIGVKPSKGAIELGGWYLESKVQMWVKKKNNSIFQV